MREKILESAREKIGTPWHHNQKVKGVGYDCLRFWQLVAEEAGLELKNIPEYYGWFSSMEQVVNYCAKSFTQIDITKTEPADLILLSYNGIPHLGIAEWMEEYNCLGIIHCSNQHKKVVRHSLDGGMLRRWKASFRC